jgi:transcriptional regulator with XRE-family HTH domain
LNQEVVAPLPSSVRDPIYQELIASIVEARNTAELTQQVVAKRLGRPQSYLAKIEGCERRIDVIELLQIAKAIGFDPVALVRKAWTKVRDASGS